MTTPNTFKSLIDQLRPIKQLGGISALLGWDQETYMPSGAVEARADQSALLSGVIHEKWTSAELRKELEKWIDVETGTCHDKSLPPESKQFIQEVYRDWRQSNALPKDFVEAFSKQTSLSQHAWQDARKTNDFKAFAPHLESMIRMAKEKAEHVGYKTVPYDALLDEFEPGGTQAQLTPLFKTLREGIVDLLKDIQESDATFAKLTGPFDEQAQWDFGIDVLNEMGYDFDRGRQDISGHPFTTDFHPTDVRVTTRVDESNIMEAFSSTAHEGGHGLYEQGFDQEWYGTPFCDSISLGIHESQSRLWEHYVGTSWSFWKGHHAKLQSYFPDKLSGIDTKEFYRSINQVQPSLIRVGADEVTYNLHILIRFEMEQHLFNETVNVMDLPEMWNAKYKEYLGITPPTDSDGILQDVHWSFGLFGYFPTYTLGNLYGRMMFEQAEQELPNLAANIEEGHLTGLTQWLNHKVHQVGRRRSAADLIKDITQKELTPEPFLKYLRHKYGTIYGF
ncbi:carboxypeptidase M32 [bacterium]|jgi:carboxypeptidase Taq|nr:carboxypeptidase M32 [bacterium]